MPIQNTAASRATHVGAAASRAVAEQTYQRMEATVPADKEGEALSALRGLAGVVIPEVELRVSRGRVFGVNTTIEIIGKGTPDELATLQNIVRNSMDASAGPGEPSNEAQARRLLSIDSPYLPDPEPEPIAGNLLALRMDVLSGRYIHPEPSPWGNRHPHPMD